MTKNSGGESINKGPAREPDREPVGEVAGNAVRKGEDPSPDDRERGATSEAEDCTAHDRAG